MSPQIEIFRGRADEARADAEAALLSNVRDRCLRSAAAWDDMAARAQRTEKMRDRLATEKQAARAAAAAPAAAL
jgi:hypothetical protein